MRLVFMLVLLCGCEARLATPPSDATAPPVSRSAGWPAPADVARTEAPAAPSRAADVAKDEPAPGARSGALPNGLHNPMPGGTLAGYAADTGLDIAGSPRPVFAIAAGTLDYAEEGHTLWTGRHDTRFTIRFALDAPLPAPSGERLVTHVYYGHLSKLAHHQAEGETPRRHVDAGEYLGMSGVARGSPHLHVGLLLDGDVSQAWGTFLSADEVREVLGGLRNKTRLPEDPAAAAWTALNRADAKGRPGGPPG